MRYLGLKIPNLKFLFKREGTMLSYDCQFNQVDTIEGSRNRGPEQVFN